MTEINYEEWTKALEEATGATDANAGYTSAELRDLLHLSVSKVQIFLREGIKSGKILRTERHVTKDWDGRGRIYSVYRLIK
jgi:hypothetical protein